MEFKRAEYMCSVCGKRQIKNISAGRPEPGNCPRKEKFKNGKMRPHTWVLNRKMP